MQLSMLPGIVFLLLVSSAYCKKCASLAETSFVESAGSRWLSNLLTESQPSTTEQCHSACARDSNCAAYVYWPNGNCQLFATAPEAGYLLAQDKDATHFQKVCLPSTRDRACGRSFERFAQMILVGHAEEVLEPVTRDQCLDACQSAEFCKSAMFFYAGGHCVLNSVDAIQRPQLFSPAALNDTIVDFYETRCEGTWSNWGAWSDCSDELQTRSRICLQGFQRCRGASDIARPCVYDPSPSSTVKPLQHYLNSLFKNSAQSSSRGVKRSDPIDHCLSFMRLGFASYSDCLRQTYTLS